MKSLVKVTKADLTLSIESIQIDTCFTAPRLHQLEEAVGRKQLIKAVFALVEVALKAWNKKGMNTQQIFLFTEDFVNRYPRTASLHDLAFMFKMARTASFGENKEGPSYGSIDSETLFTWFRLYLSHKREMKYMKKREEHFTESASDEVAQKWIDKLKAKYTVK